MFYSYLLWKGKDTRFLSNHLQATVARSVGVPARPAAAAALTCNNSAASSSSSSSSHTGNGSVSDVITPAGLNSDRRRAVTRESDMSRLMNTSDIFTAAEEGGLNLSVDVAMEEEEYASHSATENSAGQQSVPSRRKRKRDQSAELQERAAVVMGQAVASGIATSLGSSMTVSPAYMEFRKQSQQANAKLKAAQVELVNQQTLQMQAQIERTKIDNEIQRIQGALSVPSFLTPAMQSQLQEKLMQLLMAPNV